MNNNISKIAESIAKDAKDNSIQQLIKQYESDIEKEIDFLIANRDKALEVVHALFPEGIPDNSIFYKKLTRISRCFGFKSIAYSLIGLMWVESYKLLPEENRQKLLMLLTNDKNVNFFMVIPSLSFFLSEIELPSDFAGDWFDALFKKVSNDLAGGGVFKGIENYAYHFPVSGLRVFEKIIARGFSQSNLQIPSIILGTLRAAVNAGIFQEDIVDKWDGRLIQSPRTEFRLCYYQSLLISFRRGVLTTDELEAKLNRMTEGTQEEIDAAFGILYRCLLNNLKDVSFIAFACQWYQHHILNGSDLAKYYVAKSVLMLTDAIKENLIDASETDKLIIRMQPVAASSQNIWQNIEHYLVSRLHIDKKSFYSVLSRLSGVTSKDLLSRFRNGGFEYLISEMQRLDLSDFITKLIISPEKNIRELGFILFEEIKLDSLNQDTLSTANDNQLRIILLESKRKPFVGEVASRFFILLEARFNRAAALLENEFKQEMLRQAINYQGECFEAWQRMNNPSELIRSVVQSAEQYFNKTQSIANLSAVSFVFPELRQAVQISNRVFSRKIAEGASKSTYAQLAKNYDIIYGNQWSSVIEGNLSDPKPFQESAHSFELPRLELIDPEGMTIRRMQAGVEIDEILKTGE